MNRRGSRAGPMRHACRRNDAAFVSNIKFDRCCVRQRDHAAKQRVSAFDVALFGRASRPGQGPLLGVKRTCPGHVAMAANDPQDQGASKPFDFITANDVGDEINDAKAFAAWI